MRAGWETLRPTARAAVEARTGPVLKAEPVSDGTANQFTAVLHPADGPAVFCKGVHGTGPHVRMLRAEHTISPYLGGLAPTVLWQAGADDWAFLGFEYLPGRGADLTPGSPDLPLVADTLEHMRQLLTPCPPVPTLPLADRWARFPAWAQFAEQPAAGLDPWAAEHLGNLARWEQRAPEAVDGATLAHCVLAWNNILIGPGGVRVVDWALAGRAAPWVDTAFMALRLIQYGQTLQEAETWAQQVTGWPADVDAVTAFAVAVAGIRAHRASAVGAPAHMPQLAAAALTWAQYRLR